jgi:hypothetical protein
MQYGLLKGWFFFVLALMLLVSEKNYGQPLTVSDSIRVSIAPDYNKVGKLHRRFFGNGYRSSWAAPVWLRVCYLSKEKGGLTIVKKGGGLQTKSLRLKDSSGKEWVLRTIQKYPEQGLPPNIRSGLAKDILQDQVVTAHPFASLTIPPLAEALAITHSSPEIIYVADDTALREFRKEFANAVYLLEEREPTGDNDNSEKVQEALQNNHDVKVEQQIVLRARLLDIILGDWDRHEDQWRWKKQKEKSNTFYTPVPRDRDMVYYNTTGIFPWVVSHQWLKSKFQGFHDGIRDINGFNVNARYFDRYFLNEPDEAAWKNAISFVQQTLSDSLITAAIHRLPDTIFSLTGPLLVHTLIARRNNIAEYAMSYYRFISTTVEIPASDKREHFFISSDTNKRVMVTVSKLKNDGSIGSTIYRRSFEPSVTKEIRLYGMAGNDVFIMDSSFNSSIRIRMIGGSGEDSFFISPAAKGKQDIYLYDRKDEPNYLPENSFAKLRLSKDSMVNQFDKRSFIYDRFAPGILANYSLDEGIILRAGFFDEKQGFRKHPYAFRHELLMNYSFSRKTFLFTYNAIFKKLIRNSDLVVDLYSRGPQNLSNFFGIGNETVFINKEDQEISYYRSRYDYVNASVQLHHPFARHWQFSGGMAMQYYTSNSSNNNGRFFDDYNKQFPDADLYKSKIYAGLVTGITLDTRNNTQFPTKGIYWNTNIKAMQQLNGGHLTHGQLLSEINFYTAPGNNNFVIANRTGVGVMAGNPSFFQLLYLGGAQTMRGFHTNRFAGKTALYNNTELRFKLFDFNSYLLPGTVGMIAFNDIGRVWVPGESSAQWHDSYGTGLYIVPAQLILIQFVIGFSREGSLPYISIGYRF